MKTVLPTLYRAKSDVEAMPITEYFVGLASGVLFAVVIPLFMYGHKIVDDKKSSCEQKLVQLIISIAPKVAQTKIVDETDKTSLYNTLQIYALCEYYFGAAWRSGIVAALLFYGSATSEAFGVLFVGSPLSWIIGVFGAMAFLFFVIFLWQLMSTIRSQV